MDNWEEIRKEWETSEISFKELAEKYNLKDSTIRSRKNREKWQRNATTQNATQRKNVATRNETVTNKKEVIEPAEVIEFENDDFTDKQRLFISFYVKYWNATKAYQKAYKCSRETALVNGPRLLGNARIKEEVIRVRDGITNEAILDKRTLIQKWIDIAFADITDYVQFGKVEEISYNEDGEPELDMNGNIKTWTRNFVNLNDSEEIDGTLVTEVKQGKDGITVKLADKMKALEYLSKHLDLLNDNELKQLRNEQARLNIDKTNAEIADLSKNQGASVTVIIEDDVYE